MIVVYRVAIGYFTAILFESDGITRRPNRYPCKTREEIWNKYSNPAPFHQKLHCLFCLFFVKRHNVLYDAMFIPVTDSLVSSTVRICVNIL